MYKIQQTPQLAAKIEEYREAKQAADLAKAKLDAAKQAVLDDPIMASARMIELNRINEAGTALSGSIEVYDAAMTKVLTVSNVGWKIKFDQSLAMEHLSSHPGAEAYLRREVKLDTRAFLKAAARNEELVDEVGLVYQDATPSLK
jgi:hypothetical protein